ncbi:MAG: hypothetical protein JWL80_458 [Parcubacteria group bacterium]|nr:hypothetical protein [Parcubacteria group bacterium]
MNRAVSTVVCAVLILAFPAWIYIPALCIPIALFDFYWEGIILAFFIDVMYGTRVHTGISLYFPFAESAAVLVLLLLPIKRRLR